MKNRPDRKLVYRTRKSEQLNAPGLDAKLHENRRCRLGQGSLAKDGSKLVNAAKRRVGEHGEKAVDGLQRRNRSVGRKLMRFSDMWRS